MPRELFDDLDSIPWAKLRQTYGRARRAPYWIRALDSDVEDERLEAINDFLLSQAFHQHTLYTSTPYVILFVIEALSSSELANRDSGMDSPMKRELLNFLWLCAQAGQAAMQGRPFRGSPTVEGAIKGGKGVYEIFLDDPDEPSRRMADWLYRYADAEN